MRSRRNCRSSIVWAVSLAVGLLGTGVRADGLYTITNLGSGNITLNTAGGGSSVFNAGSGPGPDSVYYATDQFVSVSNGQSTYSFVATPSSNLSIQAMNNIPSELPDGRYAYGSYYQSGLINSNGAAVFIGQDHPTNNGESGIYDEAAYAAQRNSNGTWSQPVALGLNFSEVNAVANGSINVVGINPANQALIFTQYVNDYGNNAYLYNFNTHTLTDLGALPAITTGLYGRLTPIAIDNQGQVLLEAYQFTDPGGVPETLLLTPSGEPSNPLPTPEPATWISWIVIGGIASYATKRRTRVRSS